MSLLAFFSGSTVYERKTPIANPMSDPAYGVMGTIVKLNGQASSDPEAIPGKSGIDASTSGSSVSSPTGNFSGADVGRVIRLSGVDAGQYQIVGISSTTAVVVAKLDGGGVSFLGSSNRAWHIDDSLSYEWRFVSIPIGSRVTAEDFRKLETDSSLVSFSPDVVGEYVIGLIVSNGVLSSVEATTRVSIRAILVPHGRGLVPDGKFIWSYIRDIWQEVENKEVFETFWSALVQICGAELLKLYQADFNKSIRDIQDLYQRRWLAYEPKLDITEADCTFYLGNSAAGSGGNTKNLSLKGQAIILSSSEVIVVKGSVDPDVLNATFIITTDSMDPANIGSYPLQGPNLAHTGYKIALSPPEVVGPNPIPGKLLSGVQFYFAFQSTTWSMAPIGILDYALAQSETPPPVDWMTMLYSGIIGSYGAGLIHVGDIIHYPSGPNAGYYRIVDKSGSFVTVDHAPIGASQLGINLSNIYRPVEFEVSPAVAQSATSTGFSIPVVEGNDLSLLAPGRLITIGALTYTLLRAFVDNNQLVPSVVISTDGGLVLVGQVGLYWRVANTLVSSSQNFEILGVSPGDLIEFDITNDNANLMSSFRAQVVGVDRYRLSFVFTDEAVTAGAVPTIPTDSILKLAEDFGVSGVKVGQDGSLTYSGSAAALISVLNSGSFKSKYWNVPLKASTDFNILNGVFHLHPKFIVRNSKVPVDDGVKSIPILQDWIVQPVTTQHDAKTFQVRKDTEYEIARLPVSLVENSDFLVDNEIAFSGDMTFDSGTNSLVVDTGHFLERGIKNGDTVEISSPSTLVDTYYVIGVPSNDTLVLHKSIPLYALGTLVTAKIVIRRRGVGRFIRFLPGWFTAAVPAPNRLWAEVSFFDNMPSVEDNFGILVGLTQADLEAVSTDINYRQAISGLMYAYTNGSAISKIRLGAQIILGLPFAEHRGIIRSIENDYRLDDFGNATLGRLLIEDIDSVGKTLGTLRIYTFPIDPISTLAGLEINPATGKEYAVGDIVELFAALSKGVEVTDYLTNPDPSPSASSLLRQFHTTRLRANDNLFSVKELGLLSDFLKRITPSYVALVISSASEFSDSTSITDSTNLKIATNGNDTPFVDQVSMWMPVVSKYDLRSSLGLSSTEWDTGPAWLRVCGVDSLSTTYPTSDATYPAGGFVTPTAGEGPVVKPGDMLLIHGSANSGMYPITVVTNTVLTVSGLPASGFQTAMQSFCILRAATGEIRRGVGDSDGAGTLTVEVGLRADGVAVGDLLVTEDRYRTTIVGVGPIPTSYDGVGSVTAALTAGTLTVLPALPSFTGKNYRIYRESFVESPYAEDSAILVSTGTAYSSFSNPYLRALLDVGDEVQVQDTGLTRLVVLDPVNLVLAPVLAAGSYTVKICKKKSDAAPISWDYVSKFAPQDSADISQWETQSVATCTASSPIVALQEERVSSAPYPGPIPNPAFPPQPASISLSKPGDLLILLSGGNASVDVGYGPGVYPIKEVASPNVTITTNLTSNDPSAWKILRRR